MRFLWYNKRNGRDGVMDVGNPIYTLVVVLFVLLAGCGDGSD